MSKRRKTTQSDAIPGQAKKTRLSKALGAASLTRPNSETPAPAYFDFAPEAEEVSPAAPSFQAPQLFNTRPGFPAAPAPLPAPEVESPAPEAPPAALMESLTLIDFKPPAPVSDQPPAPQQLESSPLPKSDALPVAHEAAPPLPRRKTRMTLVQEFNITKLVAETETQSQKVIPIESVDDFNAAMHYFTGQAEGRTYTAELRFRASFTPIQDMKVVSEPEVETAPADNWIVADDVFAPAASTAPHMAPPANSGFSMLDLIDESYRTIQANPTFSQSRQGQAGLSVDWSQPIAKLPDVQTGLMGGMVGNTKGNGAQYKNHWSKR